MTHKLTVAAHRWLAPASLYHLVVDLPPPSAVPKSSALIVGIVDLIEARVGEVISLHFDFNL